MNMHCTHEVLILIYLSCVWGGWRWHTLSICKYKINASWESAPFRYLQGKNWHFDNGETSVCVSSAVSLYNNNTVMEVNCIFKQFLPFFFKSKGDTMKSEEIKILNEHTGPINIPQKKLSLKQGMIDTSANDTAIQICFNHIDNILHTT